MPVTLRDIAKTLNVSVSTVSYALNGGPRTVPDDVRERVQNTAKELGYRPNRLAKMLRTAATRTVGVVPAVTVRDFSLGPHFQAAFNGIVNAGETYGYDALIYSACHRKPLEFANALLDGRADGLIFLAPAADVSIFRFVESAEVPCVVVGAHPTENVPSFSCDNEAGVRKVVDHLVSLGHTRIGFMTGHPNMEDAHLRERAFRKHIKLRGLQVREDWVYPGTFLPEDGAHLARRFPHLKDRPTAIFFANDEMAHGFLRTCDRSAVRVPDDLSIVGFDDSPISSLCYPTLTTVRQPVKEMGFAAMEALVVMLESGNPVSSQIFDTELVLRDSTSRPKEGNVSYE
jgi:DNA-binding LacI/PurR family transcriptional regulator